MTRNWWNQEVGFLRETPTVTATSQVNRRGRLPRVVGELTGVGGSRHVVDEEVEEVEIEPATTARELGRVIHAKDTSYLELVFKDDAGVAHKSYRFKNGALIHWNVNMKSKSPADVTRVLGSQTTFTNTIAPMNTQQPRRRIPEVQFRVLIIEGQIRERWSSYKESVTRDLSIRTLLSQTPSRQCTRSNPVVKFERSNSDESRGQASSAGLKHSEPWAMAATHFLGESRADVVGRLETQRATRPLSTPPIVWISHSSSITKTQP
ncbi:hypothetical protein EDB89DRAFT_2246772 [Lactarius sanguifluus]|nr:hypothetical protein EDB89DRAFT_2246772 [Lactarius sanguifluus]